MDIGHTHLEASIAAGTGPQTLLELAAASRTGWADLPAELAARLAAVGDTAGESWLNLLGVVLDAGAPYDTGRLTEALRELDPIELRRHLLGRYAWSWCTLGGIDDIEAAALGDQTAVHRLFRRPRYYGGRAEQALATLLSVEPDETRRRIVAAVDAWVAAKDSPAQEELEAAAREAEAVLTAHGPLVAIERLAGGYRYVPEIEAERIVLVPHLEPTIALLLGQHRSARVIAYRVAPDRGGQERLVALGRALADPKRVEILALVGRGMGRASDLVSETGLTRSTVHHHLALLRDAGLVALEGNARAYTYVPRHGAAADAAALVAQITGTEED